MSGSTAYSSASAFSATTNSAEAFDYDELMGLLVNFSKAQVGGYTPTWTPAQATVMLMELRTRLQSLAAALEGLEPQLQFVRKEGGHRHLVNARGVILGHIASISDRIPQFDAHPTTLHFIQIQKFLAEVLAEDIAKLQRRHTRVVIKRSGSARRLSSNASSSASGSGSYDSPPSSGSNSSSNSGYASRGGARRGSRRGKKLTRRRR
jgi:hypothetical protein